MTVAERLFGLETEYAYSALGCHGRRLPHDETVAEFMRLARKRLSHLPHRSGGGIFLQNGARFYLDTGNHPEMTTPELVNPWDACRYVLAGERILAGLAAEQVSQNRKINQVIITKANVAYAVPTTWACHESYGHRADPATLPEQIIPHLVSRILYTGAGGFNNTKAGLEFMISPRVAHLVRTTSDHSTSNRGIYHTKDESLAFPGAHRLHLLCGESLCSETATWLKMGTTALVVAMAEAGLKRGGNVQLRRPLAAMRRFAVDVDCRSVDHNLKACDIQRSYLELAEAHLDAAFMPSWAAAVCAKWRDVLDRIESGRSAVSKTLDWAIKLQTYERFIQRAGLEWQTVSVWNRVLEQLAQSYYGCQDAKRRPAGKSQLNFKELIRRSSPIAGEVQRQTPFLSENGLAWQDLDAFLSLRSQLFELDTRFGQLGGEGIFSLMDQSGLLDHHVEGIDNIEHAVANPPGIGRARLRGQCIRRLSTNGGESCCDWTHVWDSRNRRYLDLSDPFASKETWKDLPDRESEHPDIPFYRPQRIVEQIWGLYDRGDYEHAWQFLDNALRIREILGDSRGADLLRLHALVQSRRGFLDRNSIGDGVLLSGPPTMSEINDRVCLLRFHGLAPAAEIAEWIERGLEFVSDPTETDRSTIASFYDHYGCFLLSQGQLEEARTVLEQVCSGRLSAPASRRIQGRSRAMLGEVYRRLGRFDDAHQILDSAKSLQTRHLFQGDLADFTLTNLAKLQPDRHMSRPLLDEAKEIQTRLHNRMGEARTLLLQARLCFDPERAQSIKQRVLELKRQLPALQKCRLLRKVLRYWNAWASGDSLPRDTGDFYHGV